MDSNLRNELRGLWLGLLGVVIFAMTLPMTRLAVGPAADPQLPPLFVTAGRAAFAGLLSLVRSMATEFAPQGVRVNGILIGLVESGQWRRRFEAREQTELDWTAWSSQLAKSKHIPLGRLGLPIEAARAILFLASPLASYTTGAHIDISGGHSRHA